MRTRSLFCCLAVLCLGTPAILQGQSQRSDDTSVPVPTSVGAPAGVRLYRPGHWGSVGIEILNPGDDAAVAHASVLFKDSPYLQFARRLWVPPQSKRLAQLPVLAPDQEVNYAYTIEARVSHERDGESVPLRDMGGALQRNMFLLATDEPRLSAMFPDVEEELYLPSPTPYDVMVAMRLAGGQTRRVGEFSQPIMPDQERDLHAVDQITIHNELPFRDMATMNTLRQWLYNGGRMWIMLDKVNVNDVATMLGNQFTSSVVDRVDLTEVGMTSLQAAMAPEPRTYEIPVPMVRMLVSNADVIYAVNDWPAAFVQQFGRGRVLFTTLGPRAWIRPNTPEDRQPDDQLRRADWVALPMLRELSPYMMQRDNQGMRYAGAQLENYLAERIGYQIVPRAPVAAILTVFVVGLGVTGGVLIRRGRHAHLAWLAPTLVILAAVPISLMGAARQRAVPRTVAVAQLIRLEGDSRLAHVEGLLAFYHQQPSDLAFSGDGAGAMIPDNTGQERTSRQLVWQDFDQWQWEKLKLTGGVRLTPLDTSIRLEEAVRAEATFDEKGVSGQLFAADFPVPQDALIVMPTRRGLKLSVDKDGRFSAPPESVLAPRQFVASELLTDEQSRRQNWLRQIFDVPGPSPLCHGPTLLFWADPHVGELQLPDDAVVTGTALAYIPLTMHAPTSESVSIPSPFLAFRPVAGPTGRGVSSTYHVANGEWVTMTAASDTWLRIQMPTEVLPGTLERLHVRLNMQAPSRKAQLAVLRDGEVAIVAQRDNPGEVFGVTIEAADGLALDEEGGVMLGILVSESFSENRRSAEWRIQDLQLTAEVRRP